jgi:hypothetical protein
MPLVFLEEGAAKVPSADGDNDGANGGEDDAAFAFSLETNATTAIVAATYPIVVQNAIVYPSSDLNLTSIELIRAARRLSELATSSRFPSRFTLTRRRVVGAVVVGVAMGSLIRRPGGLSIVMLCGKP